MAYPKKILVSTDFSACSDDALAYAIQLALGMKSEKIVLLHAYVTPAMAFPSASEALSPELVTSIVSSAEHDIAARANRVRAAGIPVEVCLRDGDPRDEIMQAAEDYQVDLICLGTHGRRGFAHALIGSVAERIVRAAKIPVLTVRHPST